MVTIVDYAKRQSRDGFDFFTLTLQGGIEMVKSQETGNYYATAKKATVTSTFSEETCQSLIGQQIPGSVQKLRVEPYEFTIKETGEVIRLSHSWIYLKEGETLEERISEGAVVAPTKEFA